MYAFFAAAPFQRHLDLVHRLSRTLAFDFKCVQTQSALVVSLLFYVDADEREQVVQSLRQQGARLNDRVPVEVVSFQ